MNRETARDILIARINEVLKLRTNLSPSIEILDAQGALLEMPRVLDLDKIPATIAWLGPVDVDYIFHSADRLDRFLHMIPAIESEWERGLANLTSGEKDYLFRGNHAISNAAFLSYAQSKMGTHDNLIEALLDLAAHDDLKTVPLLINSYALTLIRDILEDEKPQAPETPERTAP